jgi:hypothetical protein
MAVTDNGNASVHRRVLVMAGASPFRLVLCLSHKTRVSLLVMLGKFLDGRPATVDAVYLTPHPAHACTSDSHKPAQHGFVLRGVEAARVPDFNRM